MGYQANSVVSDFLIRHGEQEKLLVAAVHQYANDQFTKITDAKDLFNSFGFSVSFNSSGDINDIGFEYQPYHQDSIYELFRLISPYVLKGSYVTFVGDDDAFWSFYFDGQSFQKFNGKMVYPGMPMSGPEKVREPSVERSNLIYIQVLYDGQECLHLDTVQFACLPHVMPDDVVQAISAAKEGIPRDEEDDRIIWVDEVLNRAASVLNAEWRYILIYDTIVID